MRSSQYGLMMVQSRHAVQQLMEEGFFSLNNLLSGVRQEVP
jgi:hypothetical protein